MLTTIFLKLLEISIQASFFILAIIFIRLCFKRLPKRYVCILWGLVALRLLCPVQITSEFSLVPNASRVQNLENVSYTLEDIESPNIDISTNILPNTDTGKATPAYSYTKDIPSHSSDGVVDTYTYKKGGSVQITIDIPTLLTTIWIIGTIIFVSYGIFSYFRTKMQLREAVHDTDNIWYCNMPSPFVLGYMKPRIYIPFSVNKEHLSYIIAHEKSHIAHGDHFGKLLGYVILCVYWFNPIVWASYILYCRDLELACDERVLTKLGMEQKKAYSNALLFCSVSNKVLLQSPLAFSEVAIKERIINILHYKKPGFWTVVLAIVLCAISVVFFMTSSKSDDNTDEIQAESPVPGSETFSLTELTEGTEPISHYETETDFVLANTNYWKERLLTEGKITAEQEVYEYREGYNLRPSTMSLHELTDVICYYYTLDDHYIATLYRTTVTCKREPDGFYIYAYDHTALDSATTAAQAEEMPVLYDEYFLDGIEDNTWTLGQHVTDRYIQDMFSSFIISDNSDVETPAKALEVLMHFSGGTPETFPGRDDNHSIVLYTFADGSQAAYSITRTRNGNSTNSAGYYWYPTGTVSLETAEKARRTENFILQSTVRDLEKVTEQYELVDTLAEMPKTYTTDAFRVMDEIPEKDVTLYSLLDGTAMIIKDGNTLYPVFYQWLTVGRTILPQIYKNDYDQDGVQEYALYTLASSGSDCQIMQLTILEPKDNESLRMQTYTSGSLLAAINSSISYEYKNHAFTIKTKKEEVELNVEYWEEKTNSVYCQLGWGDFIELEERDGQWWVIIPAGIKTEYNVTPWYDCGVTLTAPVTYYNDKYFELGNLSMEVVDDRSYFGD